jgi:hypothetical protein
MSEITKALRWLANETEFVFAAETLTDAAETIDRLTAENARLDEELGRCTSGNGTYISLESHDRILAKLTADLLQKTQQLKQQNAKLTERLAAAVEDMRFVFEQKRRYADSEVLDGVDCICPLCACWLGDGAKSCDGDCNNAQWRGEANE